MFRVLFSKIKVVGHVRPVPCELSSLRFCSTDKNSQNPPIPCIDQDPTIDLPLPEYQYKENEPLDTQKARLIYQSRKRGMLENDILLSTFAAKFLPKMTAGQVHQYDKLINGVSNDWDIYYWATETKPMPEEYNNEIMQMLKKHVKNELRETRYRQPDLH